MLEWYLKNISHPWLKLSFPLLAILDCILKNVEEIAAIEIPLHHSTAITIAGFLWLLSGTLYICGLAFDRWMKDKKKEARVYFLFILAIAIATTLTPGTDYHF